MADEQVETEYSTANENHGSIRDNVDVLHSGMLLFLAQDGATDGRQQSIITGAGAYLVPE